MLGSCAVQQRVNYGGALKGGDVGYDPATCARLRRLAARRFDFPYRGDYTLTVSYPRCQDPDRPVSYQFRFRY